MGFLRRLFGLKDRALEPEKGLAEHMAFLDSLRMPAIGLSRSAGKPFSRLGGLPTMPDSLRWPAWKEEPLSFLCQFDLSEVPAGCRGPLLPASGLLYFFYDQAQRSWGFDPKDRGSWQVLHAVCAAAECRPRERPDGLDKEAVFAGKHVEFSPIMTYPDCQDERVASLTLRDQQTDEYCELQSSASGGGPAHRLLGYPYPVQASDMDLECQLASNGLYVGDSSGYNHPMAEALKPGRSDWVLLLQLDTDDEARMMWGDCGMLYFWIKRADLQGARFGDCWMILQCS